MSDSTRTLIQCDFDGTVTEADVSFMMLDAYADGDWRQRFRDYQEGKISVGRFNMDAFAMVKADRESMLKVYKGNIVVRPGFNAMVDYCRTRGFRFIICSNGLDFYIRDIMAEMGLGDVEVFAARTRFQDNNVRVQYIAPDGNELDNNFKGAHVDKFLSEGYRIVYIGNGASDIAPATLCHHIFATGTLLAHCRQTDLNYTAFDDFDQVIRKLEVL